MKVLLIIGISLLTYPLYAGMGPPMGPPMPHCGFGPFPPCPVPFGGIEYLIFGGSLLAYKKFKKIKPK